MLVSLEYPWNLTLDATLLKCFAMSFYVTRGTIRWSPYYAITPGGERSNVRVRERRNDGERGEEKVRERRILEREIQRGNVWRGERGSERERTKLERES